MYKDITVIPSDDVIIIDGVVKHITSIPNSYNGHTIHAIQWHNGNGELETIDMKNIAIGYSDLSHWIAMFENAPDIVEDDNSSMETSNGVRITLEQRVAAMEDALAEMMEGM